MDGSSGVKSGEVCSSVVGGHQLRGVRRCNGFDSSVSNRVVGLLVPWKEERSKSGSHQTDRTGHESRLGVDKLLEVGLRAGNPVVRNGNLSVNLTFTRASAGINTSKCAQLRLLVSVEGVAEGLDEFGHARLCFVILNSEISGVILFTSVIPVANNMDTSLLESVELRSALLAGDIRSVGVIGASCQVLGAVWDCQAPVQVVANVVSWDSLHLSSGSLVVGNRGDARLVLSELAFGLQNRSGHDGNPRVNHTKLSVISAFIRELSIILNFTDLVIPVRSRAHRLNNLFITIISGSIKELSVEVCLNAISRDDRSVLAHVGCEFVGTGIFTILNWLRVEAADDVTTQIGSVGLPVGALNLRQLATLKDDRVGSCAHPVPTGSPVQRFTFVAVLVQKRIRDGIVLSTETVSCL